MERFIFRRLFLLLILSNISLPAFTWGFFAHKNIARLAVFTLPAPMSGFYKANLDYLMETAVLPDKRRYILKEEAPRHYMDLEFYQDSFRISIPVSLEEAEEKFPEDSLMKHGILPWHLQVMRKRLTEAFKVKDGDKVLKLSAELCHYLADAHVPLHTTRNYNGQLTNQVGIHGLWESRLPELFFQDYNFFVGPAGYMESDEQLFFNIIFDSHSCLDSVLRFEKDASSDFPEDRKYSLEERGNSIVKVYSREFCNHYHLLLSGQVERRMRASVKLTGSIWYSCWVDAGRPDLKNLITTKTEKQNKKSQEEDHENCVH